MNHPCPQSDVTDTLNKAQAANDALKQREAAAGQRAAAAKADAPWAQHPAAVTTSTQLRGAAGIKRPAAAAGGGSGSGGGHPQHSTNEAAGRTAFSPPSGRSRPSTAPAPAENRSQSSGAATAAATAVRSSTGELHGVCYVLHPPGSVKACGMPKQVMFSKLQITDLILNASGWEIFLLVLGSWSFRKQMPMMKTRATRIST